MSRNYLNSHAFRDHDASWDGQRWRGPPNTHPNPLSGWSEDNLDPDEIEAEAESAVGMEQPR